MFNRPPKRNSSFAPLNKLGKLENKSFSVYKSRPWDEPALESARKLDSLKRQNSDRDFYYEKGDDDAISFTDYYYLVNMIFESMKKVH